MALPPPDRGHARRSSSAKFAKRPEIAEANVDARSRPATPTARRPRTSPSQYEVAPAHAARPGVYRNITGNQALALRPDRRERRSRGLPLFLGAYPITPASRDPRGARAAQAASASAPSRPRTRSPPSARRSARRSAARSASPPRAARASCSSRRRSGSRSRSSCRSLILDIQRAGPSTGMPTKPEQADLLMVLFGRNSESPVPVIAASTPRQLLRRRDRGGADRAQVPHAGLPALRRLPRERLRAVADPGRRRRCPTSRVEFATEPNRDGDVPAVPARPRDARAAVGDPRARPGSSTGSAGSRRRT